MQLIDKQQYAFYLYCLLENLVKKRKIQQCYSMLRLFEKDFISMILFFLKLLIIKLVHSFLE